MDGKSIRFENGWSETRFYEDDKLVRIGKKRDSSMVPALPRSGSEGSGRHPEEVSGSLPMGFSIYMGSYQTVTVTIIFIELFI